MTVFSDVCAKALMDIGVTEQQMQISKELFSDLNLAGALDNPSVSIKEKTKIIDRLFPENTKAFWSLLCADGRISEADDVFDSYDAAVLKKKNYIKAELAYASELTDIQKQKIKDMICSMQKTNGVILNCNCDESLIGGYTLQIGDIKYDKSILGGLNNLHRILMRR